MYKTGMKLQTSWNSLGKIRDGEKKVKKRCTLKTRFRTRCFEALTTLKQKD